MEQEEKERIRGKQGRGDTRKARQDKRKRKRRGKRKKTGKEKGDYLEYEENVRKRKWETEK